MSQHFSLRLGLRICRRTFLALPIGLPWGLHKARCDTTQKADSVRRTISVFSIGRGNFLIKLIVQPLSSTLCRPKISGFTHFGKSRGSKSRRLVRDKAHPSSNPRVLTRRCCDRFRSVGAYWVLSQLALCSPLLKALFAD